MSTVRSQVVCSDDFSTTVDQHLLVEQNDFQPTALKGQNLFALDKISGENLGAGDVVGEQFDEVLPVLRLKQVFKKLRGELREHLVAWCKHGERARACVLSQPAITTR